MPKQFIVTGRVFNIVQDAERYELKAFEVQSTAVEKTRVSKDLQSFVVE